MSKPNSRKSSRKATPRRRNSLSRFAIRTPYLIVVISVAVIVLGIVSIARMPVDLFPAMNIPVVAVATFYPGMPPEQIEGNITFHLERFFTLASGIDHIESRSLSGVSIIKVYFQPGTNPDSAVTTIASLAMAEISNLPPGTLPPFVLKFDASSLPVCLVTLRGSGLSETQLKDVSQNVVRNQLAVVMGAAVPQPFGGRRFKNAFARSFGRLLDSYSAIVARTLARPVASLAFFAVIVGAALCCFPLLGSLSFRVPMRASS
jgi:multidrug efflux pump subunit AcrB